MQSLNIIKMHSFQASIVITCKLCECRHITLIVVNACLNVPLTSPYFHKLKINDYPSLLQTKQTPESKQVPAKFKVGYSEDLQACLPTLSDYQDKKYHGIWGLAFGCYHLLHLYYMMDASHSTCFPICIFLLSFSPISNLSF